MINEEIKLQERVIAEFSDFVAFISKKITLNITLNNISDILQNLVRQGIAGCLNAEAKTERIYQLLRMGW